MINPIPPKYWPLLCAILVAGCNLVWDGTRYSNPLSQQDYERVIGNAMLVYAAVRQGVKMSE